MKKIVNIVSISAAILFGTLSVSAQNNAAATAPKVALAPVDVQQVKSTTTEPRIATAPIPEGGKVLNYQKNNNTKEEVYRGEEKITPRPDTFLKTPVTPSVMKELNPQKEADLKPTPKTAPPKSQG